MKKIILTTLIAIAAFALLLFWIIAVKLWPIVGIISVIIALIVVFVGIWMLIYDGMQTRR